MSKPVLTLETFGPWFPVWNEHFYDICTEDRRYAQSFASVHDNPSIGIYREEAAAIARLMAAAPEMLAALKSAQAALSDGAFIGPHVDAALREIDAAISAASRLRAVSQP